MEELVDWLEKMTWQIRRREDSAFRKGMVRFNEGLVCILILGRTSQSKRSCFDYLLCVYGRREQSYAL